jgi:MarR family transcriptional regulator, organic hydroperoxide resistance regulator
LFEFTLYEIDLVNEINQSVNSLYKAPDLTNHPLFHRIYFDIEIFYTEMFVRKMAVQFPDGSATVLASETIHNFLILYRYLRQYARQIDDRGTRPREFSVLRFLLESGPATVGTVQEYLYCSASVASTVIAGLEEKGYVTRTRSSEDNRVVIVELTPAGRTAAVDTPLGGIVLLRRRLHTLPPERLAVINDALRELMDLMEVSEAE